MPGALSRRSRPRSGWLSPHRCGDRIFRARSEETLSAAGCLQTAHRAWLWEKRGGYRYPLAVADSRSRQWNELWCPPTCEPARRWGRSWQRFDRPAHRAADDSRGSSFPSYASENSWFSSKGRKNRPASDAARLIFPLLRRGPTVPRSSPKLSRSSIQPFLLLPSYLLLSAAESPLQI